MSDFLQFVLFMIWFIGSVFVFFGFFRYLYEVKKYKEGDGDEIIAGLVGLSWPVWIPFFIIYLVFKLTIWLLFKMSDLAETMKG